MPNFMPSECVKSATARMPEGKRVGSSMMVPSGRRSTAQQSGKWMEGGEWGGGEHKNDEVRSGSQAGSVSLLLTVDVNVVVAEIAQPGRDQDLR